MQVSTLLTYPGIGLAVFAQQLNLPMPAMLLLVTVGALMFRGEESLHLSLVLLASIIGCLAADGCWFWLGRRWGSSVIRLVCSFTFNPQQSRERSHRIFTNWVLRLLLVAKFVPGLDAVAPPLAGAEGSTFPAFLAYDAIGSLLWAAFYVFVGFFFSNEVSLVILVVQRFGLALAVAFGTPLFLYAAWRALLMFRMVRQLKLRRISPALLSRKVFNNERVVIVDLQHYEALDDEVKAIPGAFRADPARLRTVGNLVIPNGVEVVLYCSSRNDFISARVASAIQEKGVNEVWVLDGGLEAWMTEGHPVTSDLATGEEAAGRVGIEIPL